MPFSYRDSGDDVILTPESAAAFREDPGVQFDVNALAQRNVVETGRPCDVFADDGETILVRARPS